ncbi:MAG: UvrD-helicase domain-containing protein, partial [Muribaculaceae bacterium]|nr:UvrD-helicase domain-containing protein [Muribaculaceae bacterium]
MIDSNYLEQLNEAQRAAVSYCDGPQLVIAGAGSGKTRVLTFKIVHLLHQGIDPWRILALTFTNKAANEMRERIKAMVGERTASRLWMGTFHSIFRRILATHTDRIGFKPGFTIYDSADSKALVKTIIKEMDLDDKIYKPSVVLNAISGAKNALISPAAYKASAEIIAADRHARRPQLYQIYETYCRRCFVANAMDFDDLLYFTNVLFRDNPDILHHYQEFFSYVLVDEYQDTNFAQHLIVNMLTRQSGKLCVVGDDAQSIYSFRGANIDNILQLKRQYPTLRTFKLEQNYRSTRVITNAATSLIDTNKEQL